MLLLCSHKPIYVLVLQYYSINQINIYSVPTLLGGVGGLLRNSAIFEVLSYFLGTEDDGTSRSLCAILVSTCVAAECSRIWNLYVTKV